MRIDAHQHFWKYSPAMEWITDDMSVIRRDFAPAELAGLLKENSMDGSVLVQVDQTPGETASLLKHAEENDFIKGVVGWVDLCAPIIEAELKAYRSFPKLKGFRHILQAEQPDYMLTPDFKRGIAALAPHRFTYDVLVYPHQLPAVLELVTNFPEQPFVIDHLAKPLIRSREMDTWAKYIRQVARFPNVYCKVSGMVTEADIRSWRAEDFRPYLDVVADAFGTDRLMFGSDWPVCLVAADYKQVVEIVADYFPVDAHVKIFGENATSFYHLS